MCIESVFEQFWRPSYLMSKLMSICVNLITWIYFFLWTFSIVQRFDFLGGLSLHLNHLIAWQSGISFWQFGTLPIRIFLSNLDSRHLMTSPRTLLGQFWHMSIFDDSRAVPVICQKKMPSENWFFLDEGAMRFQSVLGVLGGQIPRLYGGTISGGDDTLRGSSGALNTKCPFFHTFATA